MALLKDRGSGWQWWVLSGIVALVAVLSIVTVFVAKHGVGGHGGGQQQQQQQQQQVPPLSSPVSPSSSSVPGPPSPAAGAAPFSGGGAITKYAAPLKLTLQFFDVQKSGKLPADNPITWRGDSALDDGEDAGLDLSGGLYDAGDNVKFGLPMAFTASVLSWSILEYRPQYEEMKLLNKAMDAVKWISDYLIRAHPSDNVLYFQVGSPKADHACWERAEKMDTPRPSFKVDVQNPGAEVAAETAAAMAAASLVFRDQNSSYSDTLVSHSKQLFDFANQNRKSYTMSFSADQHYYNSTGFWDELLWAASWLYYATSEQEYLVYATGRNAQLNAGWGKAPAWFSWDDKTAGVQVLLSRHQLFRPQESTNSVFGPGLLQYKNTAEQLICALLPQSPTATSNRTKAGMLWVSQRNSVQHAVSSGFLAILYADYLASSQSELDCLGRKFAPQEIRSFAASQADYILGQNPMSMSYLVGHGDTFPQQLHHRGASIPVGASPGCKDGFRWLHSTSPNPNLAVGGLVGGPFQNDSFTDIRENSMQNEATTYNSATFAALLVGLYANGPSSLTHFGPS